MINSFRTRQALKTCCFWVVKYKPISSAYHVTSERHFRLFFEFGGSPRYGAWDLCTFSFNYVFQNRVWWEKRAKNDRISCDSSETLVSGCYPLSTFKVAEAPKKFHFFSKFNFLSNGSSEKSIGWILTEIWPFCLKEVSFQLFFSFLCDLERALQGHWGSISQF